MPLFINKRKVHAFVSNILLICAIFLENMLQQTVQKPRAAAKSALKVDSVVDVPCFVCSIQHLVSPCECDPVSCQKLEQYVLGKFKQVL